MRHVKKVLSVLLAAAMAAGMLTACGGSSENAAVEAQTTATEMAATEGAAAEIPASAPADAKSIVYGMTGTWNSLMPFDASTTNSWMIQDVLYEPLGKYGDGEVAWRAASSIDVEDEGKTWVVHLNDQVKWHDGEPSDADDWVWTMGVVAEMADEVMVMYAGEIVEYGTAEDIFDHPEHPYTQGLLKSIPRLDKDAEEDLYTIEGVVPSLNEFGTGCRFANRCPYVCEACRSQPVALTALEGQHTARCRRLNKQED